MAEVPASLELQGAIDVQEEGETLARHSLNDDLSRNNASASGEEPKYLSYAQYVGDLAEDYPEFEWLRDFFREAVPEDPPSTVTVMDCVEGTLVEKGQFSEADDKFLSVINSRQPHIHTRLILTNYEYSLFINRTFLDILGLLYDIDPYFFHQHFYYEDVALEVLPRRVKWKWKRRAWKLPTGCLQLPSDSSMQIQFSSISSTRGRERLSAYVHEDPRTQQKTILIWMRGHQNRDRGTVGRSIHEGLRFGSQRPSIHTFGRARNLVPGNMPRFFALLTRMPCDQFTIGEKDFRIFFYPYARSSLISLYQRFEKWYDFESKQEQDQLRPDSMAYEISKEKKFVERFQELRVFEREIRRIRDLGGDSEVTRKFDLLASDCRLLNAQFERSATAIKEFRADKLITAQLEEARLSAQSAVSVTRLTKLAFLFIPLSFTTSFFGMNVMELGPGNVVPLWVFFVVASGVLALCLFPLLPSLLIATLKGFEVEKSCLKITRYSHRAAIWYFLICLVFGPKISFGLCGRDLIKATGREVPESEGLTIWEAEEMLPDLNYPENFLRYWSDKAKYLRFLGRHEQERLRELDS